MFALTFPCLGGQGRPKRTSNDDPSLGSGGTSGRSRSRTNGAAGAAVAAAAAAAAGDDDDGVQYVNFNGIAGRGGGVVAVRKGGAGGVASVDVRTDGPVPGSVG